MSSLSPSILMVGGRGRMAARFSELFVHAGATVEILEQGDPPDKHDISKFEVVCICVPMHVAVETAEKIAPLISPNSLLCDINSLKEEICNVYRRSCRGEALGMHPMFGPSVTSFRNQKIVLCPVKAGPLSGWIRSVLREQGSELLESDPETHDKMMGIIQVLNHFGTMVMGEALRALNVPVRDTLKFTSPVYLIELATVGRLFAQSSELYHEIATANPHAVKMREAFLKAANDMNELLCANDRRSFAEKFRKIHDYFGSFSEEAMRLSNGIIDALPDSERS